MSKPKMAPSDTTPTNLGGLGGSLTGRALGACSILAIDPGPTESAVVRYHAPYEIVRAAKLPNQEVLDALFDRTSDPTTVLVIEEMVSYGMAVGRSVFQTAFWSGRFAQQWKIATGEEAQLLSRMEVKRQLCGSTRAGDKDIREELLHRFGPKGTKAAKGPLYGFAGDTFAALALAVAYVEIAAEAPVREQAIERERPSRVGIDRYGF